MRKFILTLIVLLIGVPAWAQISIKGGSGGGGAVTITAGTTATSGCTDGGFLYSLSSLIQCGANAINDGSVITLGGVAGSGENVVVTNGTSTRSIFIAKDNTTAVFTIADGGVSTFASTVAIPSGSAAMPFPLNNGTGGMWFSGGYPQISNATNNWLFGAAAAQTGHSGGVAIRSDGMLGFATSSTLSAPDTYLSKEAISVLQIGLDVNGAAVAQTLKAHDGITGTDIAGANLTIAGGRGTGAGAGGNLIQQTSPSLATGTTAQTLQDRTLVVAKARTLTESSATQVVLINVASGAFGGGSIEYTVQSSDGTDHQARSGRVQWAVVNKAGTETCTVSGASEAADSSTLAASLGTLTYAITTDTSAANGCYLSFNAVSSLTQTTLNIAYRITANGGTTTFTAQ